MARLNLTKRLAVSFRNKTAGLVCISYDHYNLHLFISDREHWVWGYEKDWHDGVLHAVGLGPLAMLWWSPDWERPEPNRVDYFESMAFARDLTDHFTRAARKAIAAQGKHKGS